MKNKITLQGLMGLFLSTTALLQSCTVSSSSVTVANTAKTHSIPEIDQVVTETLVENGPGVAVLVMEDGEIIHSKGYGFRDIDEQLPITPDTPFDLASVSKQMTAMGILILMEEGKLDIDDPVIDHLPDFEDPNPDNPILISDLLYHISGLADYTGDDWEGTEEEFSRLTLETHLQWLNEQEVYSDRATSRNENRAEVFEYNNSGYALLALIVQRVSGKPFPEFMKEAIFAPLQMKNTLVFSKLGQTIPNQARGYLVSEEGKIESSTLPSLMTGDGNVFSSIADLAKYDNALRNEELITADTLELAFTPGELEDGSTESAYGMGWSITEDYVEHSGGWYGTSTDYRHYTTSPITIVILSNDENYDTEFLMDKISELLED